MHCILTGLGSYGDVLPMAGLAATLSRRGHRVQLVANPYFEEVAAHAGAELLPLGTIDDYRALIRHPDLWDPLRGFRLVFGYTAECLPELYRTLAAQSVPGETVHAAHGLDLASRCLQETRGNPLATVHYAPISLCSVNDPPAFFNMPAMHRAPKWLRRGSLWLADRVMIDRVVGPTLNGLRRELGLPPVKRIFTQWALSPQRVIALFPEWFAPPPGDWPPQTRLTGFPLYDGAEDAVLPTDAAEFLDAGAPPIVFAPGSANVQASSFFAAAAEACRRLGRRGMLVTKYHDQLPPTLPDGVRAFGFVPFSRLLSRAAAVVHHGGIGTSGQTLAAGVPQVITPLAYDQLDNGRRIERLGVGRVVLGKRVNATRLVEALQPLLADPAVRGKCSEIASRCDGAAARDAACNLLEELGQQSGSEAEATSTAARGSAAVSLPR